MNRLYRDRCRQYGGVQEEVTFGIFVKFRENNDPILFALEWLIGMNL